MKPGDIYLATVGVEKHRWATPKRSSVDLAECIGRAAEAGFDGLELWEYHAAELGDDELERVREIAEGHACPVAILSTYVETVSTRGTEGTEGTEGNVAHRRRLDRVARLLGAEAYKFNISGPSRADAVRFVRDWAAETGVTFLCECHPGTMMEEPETAAGVLRELGPGRFGAILHTLSAEDDEFERDLALKEEFFRHVHVQRADVHAGRIAARAKLLKEARLELTWSIEFSSPVYDGADNDACFEAAARDMRLLRECLG